MAIDPIVGFCLWCDKDFYSMEEVEAHNADNMKACPTATSRPATLISTSTQPAAMTATRLIHTMI